MAESANLSWNYAPKINGKMITNSTIKLQVTNLEEWITDCCPIGPSQLESWKLSFRIIDGTSSCIPIHYFYDQQTWHDQIILFTSFHESDELFIKVPFSLTPYKIQFKINAQNINTNQWSIDSNTIKITVPSYGIYNNYDIGDFVDFWYEGKYIEAKISSKLEDNFYTLSFDKYDFEKGGDENDDDSWIETKVKCHASKFVATSCDAIRILSGTSHLMRLNNFIETEMDLNLTNSGSLSIFCVIIDSLYQLRDSEIDCVPVEYHKVWTQDIPQQIFVGNIIMQYLYKTLPFQYKINCLLDGKDGLLQLENVGDDQLRIINEGIFEIEQLETMKTSCDFCSCELTKWDFIFQCKNDINGLEKHCYCLWCIDQIIKLKLEMDDILKDILKDVLIPDCTEVISHFLIGQVRCIENTKNQSSNHCRKNNHCRKRKLENETLPMSKKRRLDISE